MSNTPLLVTNLVKRFEQSSGWWNAKPQPPFTAVNGISFEIKPGEVLGLLGSNGAGKTTTIQMLLGTMIPTSGEIKYFGTDFSKHRSELLKQISFASTYIRLPGRLTVYENLDFYAKLYNMPAKERAAQIEKFLKLFDLWRLKDRKSSALSAGETTRAILAKAFIPNPKIVLLDEPTASLDPDIALEVRNFVLNQRNEHNVSVLFTSHNMNEVAEVCDRVLVMQQGTIIAHDTPSSLAATVSKARVHLTTNVVKEIQEYASKQHIEVQTEEHSLTLYLEDDKIASFLAALTKQDLHYSHITIEKPTLEDYFLQIAQRKKGA